MFAAIDPNAEVGPAGMFILAGFLMIVATGTLLSGLHPRFASTASWRGGIRRSAFGSLAFSLGLVILSAAFVVRGLLNQHGSFSGVPLWLVCVGAIVTVTGPIYDLILNARK